MEKVVLVVLNYNDYETTLKFIRMIKDYNIIYKIIIVDNNSTNNSYDILSKYKNEKIDILKNEVNSGYGSGNNFGVDYAMKKYNPHYIIISNPDVYFEEDVVYKLLSKYANYNNLAIVAPKMNSINFPNEYVAWKLPSFVDIIFNNFIIFNNIVRRRLRYDNLFDKKEKVVEVLPGSFFMIDSKKFKDVGYFNNDTFLYCEEIILSYKLKEKGYINLLLNDEEYIHEHSVTIDKAYRSLLKKYSMLNKSNKVYIKECLKIKKGYVYLNDIIFCLSQLEKIIFICIKRLIKYVKR